MNACSLSAALQNADKLLREVHKAVDLDGDGLIQYEGTSTSPTIFCTD